MKALELTTLRCCASRAIQMRGNAEGRTLTCLVVKRACGERPPTLNRRSKYLRKRLGVVVVELFGEMPTRQIRCMMPTGLDHCDLLLGVGIVVRGRWIAMVRALRHAMGQVNEAGRRGADALLSRRISG